MLREFVVKSLAISMSQEVLELDVVTIAGTVMSQAPAVRALFYSMQNEKTLELLRQLPRIDFHRSEDRVFLTLLLNQM